MGQIATIIRAAEQKKVWMLTERVTPLLNGGHTGEHFSVVLAEVARERGSPPHVHRREDEAFYIIDGEMKFLSGDRLVVASAGTFVWAPRDVVHNFTGSSEALVKALLIATPTHFDRFAAGFSAPVTDPEEWPAVRPDQIATILATAPAYGIEMKMDHVMPTVVTTATSASRRMWVMGEHVSYLATSPQTGGTFTAVEIRTAPGGGPPPHVHLREDEVLYVLAGEHSVTLDGHTDVAGPGDLIWIPHGTRHRYSGVGPAPGKLLSLHTPGGFEAFFDEAGVDAADHPAPPTTDPPRPEAIAALLARHGMTA